MGHLAYILHLFLILHQVIIINNLYINWFRFARDINIVDLMLSMCVFDIIVIGLGLISVVVMIVAIIPWLGIPTVLSTCVFIFSRTIYISTSRAIKRLEGISKWNVWHLLRKSLTIAASYITFDWKSTWTKMLVIFFFF